MTDRPVLQPGPEHPITIESGEGKIVVTVAGRVIAETHDALVLREANYPPVLYIPLEDVNTSLLQVSDHATYCPYKGECSYYSIPIGAEKSVNAVWEYKQPYDALAEIKGHVAFYPDRVQRIEQQHIERVQTARIRVAGELEGSIGSAVGCLARACDHGSATKPGHSYCRYIREPF